MSALRIEEDFDDAGYERFFAEHAISPEVWRARPYVRWTMDDIDPVRQAYSGLSTRGSIVRIAKQSPGWIITRHAPRGIALPPIWPEIRPDAKVRTGKRTRHFHGDPRLAPLAEALPPKDTHSPSAMQKHIARSKNPDDHHGVNTDEIHEHWREAKYVFPSTPTVERPWEHDHDDMRLESRTRHVTGHRHRGVEVVGRHQHVSRVPDPTLSLAKRLDVHPLAYPHLANAIRVFFVLEGCIKADAVLSQGEAVFSVPSVTLWDARELSTFVDRFLVGRSVIVVPDADWIDNPMVRTQARLCQSYLGRLGITAHIAAPPASAGQKGVDDFLFAGGRLDELEVIDRYPAPGLATFVNRHARRRDQARRDVDVLWALSMHADEAGKVHPTLGAIAKIMDLSMSQVARGLESLNEIGAIAIDGDLIIDHEHWIRTGSGWWLSRNPEWRARPTIVIAPELRATQHHEQLGKHK